MTGIHWRAGTWLVIGIVVVGVILGAVGLAFRAPSPADLPVMPATRPAAQ